MHLYWFCMLNTVTFTSLWKGLLLLDGFKFAERLHVEK